MINYTPYELRQKTLTKIQVKKSAEVQEMPFVRPTTDLNYRQLGKLRHEQANKEKSTFDQSGAATLQAIT